MFHHRRPLKRWRWVGVFSEDLMVCAADVRIGPGRQAFWAFHAPGAGALRERTRLLPRRRELDLGTGRLRIDDRGVRLELELAEEDGIEARCPNGRSESWTRKQAGIAARGTLSLDGGAPQPVEARAVIDDSAGWHERVTEWRWSAGVGEDPDGTPLAWNLVAGINDPPQGSERAVWLAGVPHEVAPVEFAGELDAIHGADGSVLRFRAEAERARSENLLLVSSEYRAPFGTFSGALPGGARLASGRGVMEHHRARW